MRYLLALFFVTILSCTVAAQAPAPPDRIQQVRAITADLAVNKERAAVLLNDLGGFTGYVMRADTKTFDISSDRKQGHNKTIRFEEVLAISSNKGSVSFVPDPGVSGYGSWAEVEKLPPNTLVEITLSSGEIKAGRYRSGAADHMVLAHKERNEEWRLARDEISRVHRVRPGWSAASKGMDGGAKKGKEVVRKIEDIAGGTGRDVPPGALMVGAGIGSLAGLLKGAATGGDDTLSVLVYSQ
jgi:hypothetical protein